MKRILAIAGAALLIASCSKVGQKFDKSEGGFGGAATTEGGNANKSGASTSTTTGAPANNSAGDAEVERPAPTEAQKAAVEGGQEAKWDQQGMTFTVPKGWVKDQAQTSMYSWRSGGGGDFAFLIGNVSALGDDFPTDISLKAMYDQGVTRKKNGELEDVRWLELDGVKGVATREAPPEGKEDPRRVQWMTYRKYAGQTQMIILTLSTKARSFDKHQDALYGILYSTKLVH